MFDPPDADHIAVLIGDDRGMYDSFLLSFWSSHCFFSHHNLALNVHIGGAPLLLYVGEKLAGGFLKRNGLAKGDLYVWKSDNGPTGLDQINGPYLFSALNENSVSFQKGRFVKIDHYQPDMAGSVGFDDLGFADQITQDGLSIGAGAFLFSRPEDLSTNPNNGLQAVFHSTGRSSLYNRTELWGQTFLLDINFDSFEPGQPILADITVLYDGNVLGDDGIRSPDNGVWAKDGIVYGACNNCSPFPNIKNALFTVLS
jgi:serralysin